MSIRPTQPSTQTLASPPTEDRLALVLAAGHEAKREFCTGKCYSVSSPNVVTAFFFVKKGESVYRDMYTLDERQCENHDKLLVSEKETNRVLNRLREIANILARDKQEQKPSYYLKMNIDGDPTRGFIALLKCNNYEEEAEASVDKYLFDNGTSGYGAWKEALDRMQTFLTKNYKDENGPEFILSLS